MEENVRQELESMEKMVLNWKKVYLDDATPDGNNDFLIEEFEEEIITYVCPYVRRLYQCEYLTANESQEFLSFCQGQVEDLRNLIKEVETPPAKPGFWQKIVKETVITWRKAT
ncbi:hypothetical protein [Desulfobacca acetoxidans]|uniref:Uncharacterized protein n=1 Tax=Desulfobacca acetoxidans (strain ATCC 700848 / DSM 11109 / ASRB2) TaxID=880072 RepID=F2NF42_DESAR|nr:hypothetical protein [Desulfobacca acetoxidans]AEB08382.1 hypothetical protein Desac_0496 [Desulfobacca acetoxidans DSM 11109]